MNMLSSQHTRPPVNPPTRLRSGAMQAVLAVLALLANLDAEAQAAFESATALPSTDQMIEQLKLIPSTAQGRTRSLRNLSVEVVAEPALSLQIQFDFNSAQIRPESQDALRNLAMALLSPELSNASFVIEGHSDGKGRETYNLQLSQARAEAVREFLVRQTVQSVRLRAVGKGSSHPVNPADPMAAENRRVRIVHVQGS
ncbi:OmpA family protein [Curvibacter gracilis]|uniref:OmpA family protein n=1 Tax=Curvibacter gracilis TaxID=230310 RepID=UPI001B801C76|nr:OmpA family protein [Curvibacter gracilis]